MQEMRVDQLSKTYGEKTIFQNLSFFIHPKDKIGLIGINGTGKSSLLDILAGKDQPDSGNITHPQNFTIAYLAQQHNFSADETVAEAIFKGDSPTLQAVREYEIALEQLAKQTDTEAAQRRYQLAEERMNQLDAWLTDTNVKIILQQLGVPNLAAVIGDLSGGQQKRIALAQALVQTPDLLLLDEPTNHLDYQAIRWLTEYLKNYQGALVLVTHDRYFLDQVTSRIFELSQGSIYEYAGNYQTYLAGKAERQSEEARQSHKQKQLYKQELAWMRAGVQARGTKQQARIDRFHELSENLKKKPEQAQIELSVASQRLGKKVIEIRQGAFQIDEKVLFQELNLLIQARERLGITGRNGAGKSTLLNIIAGKIALTGGTIEIGETVKLGYYTQTNTIENTNLRVIEYLQEEAEQVTTASGEVISVTEMLERFLFPRSSHGTLVRKLSGGEQRRLFLLKILISQPNVLLLDEPTNDLDIDTLTVLEDYLTDFNGAVLAVSHDRYFLDKVAEKLLIFTGNGQTEISFSLYSDYLENKEDQATKKENKQSTASREVKADVGQTEKVKKKLTYSEQKEWETIEFEIESLEKKSQEIIEEMNQQGSDFAQLQKLEADKQRIEKELATKYQRWEYLGEFAGEA